MGIHLDFPATPVSGDKYPTTPVAGQPQYTWDGEKWTTIGAQISTAPPATALPLMDQTTALVGTAAKWAREDHVHPKIPAAPMDAQAYSGMQVNGSCEVSQANGTSSIVPPHVIDGWYANKTGAAIGPLRRAGWCSGYPTVSILYSSRCNDSAGISCRWRFCVSQPQDRGLSVLTIGLGHSKCAAVDDCILEQQCASRALFGGAA